VLRAGLALGLLAAPLAARTSSSQERPAASDDYFSFKFVACPRPALTRREPKTCSIR
jgi:hypothetical protein